MKKAAFLLVAVLALGVGPADAHWPPGAPGPTALVATVAGSVTFAPPPGPTPNAGTFTLVGPTVFVAGIFQGNPFFSNYGCGNITGNRSGDIFIDSFTSNPFACTSFFPFGGTPPPLSGNFAGIRIGPALILHLNINGFGVIPHQGGCSGVGSPVFVTVACNVY